MGRNNRTDALGVSRFNPADSGAHLVVEGSSNDPSSSSSAEPRGSAQSSAHGKAQGKGSDLRGRSSQRVKRDQPEDRARKVNRDVSRFMRTGDYAHNP